MLDEKDRAILNVRQTQWDEDDGIRVGDRLILADGSIRRVAHVWNDSVQPTLGAGEGMSFYLSGYSMSFSGGLSSAIPLDRIKKVNGETYGSVWFFHHGEVKAHNGVMALARLRIYKVE